MMYKKIIVSFILIGALFSGLTKADVQGINIRYCEDASNPKADNNKSYAIQPGIEKELCFYVYSNSATPVEVTYAFVNSALNSQGNRSCAIDTSLTNPFSRYFLGSGERTVLVQSDKPYMVKEKILVPMGMSGELNWCISYTVSNANPKAAGQIFSVVIRKTNFLSFFVGNPEAIKNEVKLVRNPWWAYSTNSNIKATIDTENNLNLSFLVKNNGNIGQSVIVSGRIQNMLGFEKAYESVAASVAPGETKEITANVGILPAYKWFFTIISNVNNTPVFAFDTSSLDPKFTAGSTQMQKATIYAFSWITLIIMVVLILIIIKFIRPRKTVRIEEIKIDIPSKK